ncbi:MAG: hypothetical protein QG575_795 [Euryarchaeota archaeon]|jgi:hypothetical protein|nr:hypothetical protein [Euryarchaeota archaeon]
MNALLPHDNSRYFGLLSSIEPHEDHQIATITVINNYRVILPLDLDLSGFINRNVGVACIAGKFYARLAGEDWDRANAKERAVSVGGGGVQTKDLHQAWHPV